jgi:hypothetical protein
MLRPLRKERGQPIGGVDAARRWARGAFCAYSSGGMVAGCGRGGLVLMRFWLQGREAVHVYAVLVEAVIDVHQETWLGRSA